MTDEPALIALQGERGAYSEQAVLAHAPDAEPVPLDRLDEVFSAVATGEVDQAVRTTRGAGGSLAATTCSCRGRSWSPSTTACSRSRDRRSRTSTASDRRNEAIRDGLAELAESARFVRVLGSYERAGEPASRAGHPNR